MARANNFRLSERDYDIFEHLSRHRMTTREILHKLFWEDSSINAVSKVTSRLVRFGFLNRYELYPPRPYFGAGPQAARLVGIFPDRCKPIGVQDLPIELGILDFCCAVKPVRDRLKVSELAQHDPRLLKKNLASNRYYIDVDHVEGNEEKRRLGYIFVDCGGEPTHVARKCDHLIEQRYKHEAFRERIDQDRFVITIVTACEEKRDAINDALDRRTWPHPVPFRFHVTPDLAHLVFRLKTF